MKKSKAALIKNSLIVTKSYIGAMTVYLVFMFSVFIISRGNVESYLPIYSGIIFILLFSIIYSKMSKIAEIENNPSYNFNPSIFRGIIYGIIGIVPLIIILNILYLIPVASVFETFKLRIIQVYIGPLYWIASLSSHNIITYCLAFLVVPIISMLGYLAGNKKVYLFKNIWEYIKEKINNNIER